MYRTSSFFVRISFAKLVRQKQVSEGLRLINNQLCNAPACTLQLAGVYLPLFPYSERILQILLNSSGVWEGFSYDQTILLGVRVFIQTICAADKYLSRTWEDSIEAAPVSCEQI